MPEHEVYEPDPDDDDTGPLQDPPGRELHASSRFGMPQVVNPRPVRRDRKPVVIRAIVVFAIVVGALVF
jgi:hypothetical protein